MGGQLGDCCRPSPSCAPTAPGWVHSPTNPSWSTSSRRPMRWPRPSRPAAATPNCRPNSATSCCRWCCTPGSPRSAEPSTFDDVARGLRDKMIRRNPHVFRPDGSLQDSFPATVQEIVLKWDAVKQAEKPGRGHAFDGVPAALPALARAQKLLDRAERAGLPAGPEAAPPRPDRRSAPPAARRRCASPRQPRPRRPRRSSVSCCSASSRPPGATDWTPNARCAAANRRFQDSPASGGAANRRRSAASGDWIAFRNLAHSRLG